MCSVIVAIDVGFSFRRLYVVVLIGICCCCCKFFFFFHSFIFLFLLFCFHLRASFCFVLFLSCTLENINDMVVHARLYVLNVKLWKKIYDKISLRMHTVLSITLYIIFLRITFRYYCFFFSLSRCLSLHLCLTISLCCCTIPNDVRPFFHFSSYECTVQREHAHDSWLVITGDFLFMQMHLAGNRWAHIHSLSPNKNWLWFELY